MIERELLPPEPKGEYDYTTEVTLTVKVRVIHTSTEATWNSRAEEIEEEVQEVVMDALNLCGYTDVQIDSKTETE